MRQQQGGTLLGFILGLIVGLAVALVVAVYVTKVPIPFMNKALSRNAEQDAAEVKKNKDWDPNAPLYGKGANKSVDKAEGKPDAAVVDAKPPAKADAAAQVDAKSADPIGDLAKVKSADTKPATPKAAESKPSVPDPFIYFVQAGAYRSTDEADAQRAKLGMLGLDAKISERDQGGRTVYRVRVGPLEVKTDAEKVREKLEAAHIDSALVRVQR